MQFTGETLGRYLTHKLDKPCRVIDIEKFGRGTSRETWFITYTTDDADRHDLVFRRDPLTGSVDYSSLHQEFFIYERLGHSAVPVAAALWWEDDPQWTDRPFYVRRHVAGSWNIPDFKNPSPDHDGLRIRISQEHMRKLALVHAVDWKALGLDRMLCTAPNVEDAATHYIDAVVELYETQRIEPNLLFLEAVEWLKGMAPVASQLSLCKGTNGLGEEIFSGEELVAMSDWEEAHIGDPAADFAFLQEFIPHIEKDGVVIWGLEQAIDYYRSVGGAPVTAASIQYYQLVRALRMMAYCHRAGMAVHRSALAPIRQAWTGIEVQHFCKQVLASAMGLAAPPVPHYFAELNTSVENSAAEENHQ